MRVAPGKKGKKGQAIKFDAKKPRFELLPPHASLQVAWVMTGGGEKYGPYNYLQGQGLAFSQMIGAAKRHLNAIERGIDVDPEFGCLHAAHLAANAMMLAEHMLLRRGVDDREHKMIEKVKNGKA